MDHQTFRKRVEPKQQINFEDSCLSGGLRCDLSVKLKALRLPLNDRISNPKSRMKNTEEIIPEIYKDWKKFLKNFMKGLSKQELGDYLVQLLSNCSPDSSSETIQCCPQDGSTLNSIAKDSLPSLPRSSDLRCQHRKQPPRADNRRSKPLNNNKHGFVKDVIKSSKNIHQDCTHEQSYFNNIISAIDFLCDMRSLFDQTLNRSVEANNMATLSPHSQNKLPQSTDKNSKRRRTGGEWCSESVITKCNKTVQTEEYLIHLLPDQDINFYHGHVHDYSEHCDINKCLVDQANSYDRLTNHFRHLQTPYPLTPPRVNLKTHQKYRSDAY